MLTCEVTCVVGIDNFWAHLGSEQDFDEFRALELAISTYCEDHRRRQDLSRSIHEGRLGISTAVSWDRNSYAVPPLATMFIRRTIFVQLKEPPNKSSAVVRPRGARAVWCRARVERTMRETEEVEVYLLDYGWRLTTSVRSVVAACPEWMLVFPAFARHCCLSSFDQTMASDSLRLSETVEMFRKAVIGQRLAAQYDPAVADCSIRLNDRRRVSLWIQRKQHGDNPRFHGTSWVENPTSLVPVAQLVLGNANIGSIKRTNNDQLCCSDKKSSAAGTAELPTGMTAVPAATVSVQRLTGSVDNSREKVAALREPPAQIWRSSPELTRLQLLLNTFVKVAIEPEPSSVPTGAIAACVQVGTSGDTPANADAPGSSSNHFAAAHRCAADAGSGSLGVAPVERFIFLPAHAENSSSRSFECSAEPPDTLSPRGPNEQVLAQLPAGGASGASLRSSCDGLATVCGDELPVHRSRLSDGSLGSFEQSSQSEYLCPRLKLDGVAQPCNEKPVPVSKGRGFRTITTASDVESRASSAAAPEHSEQRYMASATPRKDLESAFDDCYGERFADDDEGSNEKNATFGRFSDASKVWPGMPSGDGSQSDMTKNPGLKVGEVEKEEEEVTGVQRWKPPASGLFGVNQVCVVCGSTEHRRCGTAKDLFID